METIEEDNENDIEIKKLEEIMFYEIEHGLNELDSQIMSLLVQRKIQANLMKNILEKYNKSLTPKDLIKNVLNRININYSDNYATYLKSVYSTILKPF